MIIGLTFSSALKQLDGELNLGENVADNGGLRMAYMVRQSRLSIITLKSATSRMAHRKKIIWFCLVYTDYLFGACLSR